MSSLVQRLRRNPCADATRHEAADELQRLGPEVERLRILLREGSTVWTRAYQEGQKFEREHGEEIMRLRAEVGDPQADTPANAYWKEHHAVLRCAVERLKDRIDEHHKMFEPMRAEIERLRAKVERLHVAARAAFDALEDGDETGAHLILQAFFRNAALEGK